MVSLILALVVQNTEMPFTVIAGTLKAVNFFNSVLKTRFTKINLIPHFSI